MQAYLISLMCANNTYQSEFTNIDSMSRNDIISTSAILVSMIIMSVFNINISYNEIIIIRKCFHGGE